MMNRILSKCKKIGSLCKFRLFEKKIHKNTRHLHDTAIHWAVGITEHEAGFVEEAACKDYSDPIVKEGRKLLSEVTHKFSGKYSELKQLRILVHIPSSRRSPGGHSLFNNLAQSLQYIGIETRCLGWEEAIQPYLDDFRPTVFLTSDATEYLAKIDWAAVNCYRTTNTLKVGLTAALAEHNNIPLTDRLKWSKANSVDFYYTFQSPECLKVRTGYAVFSENGYKIFSVEFGANPLLYYPVPGIARDLDYVFLASSNYDKRPRYYEYLSKIFRNNVGLIDGPGWAGVKQWATPPTHRFLYARAKIGINLHIQESMDWPSELNERTYILAACGVPQLVDEAKLLSKRFSEDALFIARTPFEYNQLFEEILANPDLAQKRALKAQREVFEKHTTFHRAEKFALDLITLFNN